MHTQDRVRTLYDVLYEEGIVGVPDALPRGWAQDALDDFHAIYARQRRIPDGTVNRGRNRRYLAVHPESLRGFLDLATHPTITSLCATILGPDWQICEIGFDVPFPGATTQPWHRDFATPDETRHRRHLSSLAFNFTTIDVTPDMAPFEVAPGTHFTNGDDWRYGMFPVDQGQFDPLGVRRLPQRGDMSVRTGLTVHRGTANTTTVARPVLILGAVDGSVQTPGHDLEVTRRYYDALPAAVRDHLRVTRIVETLEPIRQRHTIEGLVMGDD